MELKQLQYFLTVAEYLNFSRAAEALYVSQPALSYQIAELERELGSPLFIRDKRKVYLSPAGTALLAPAQETLQAAGRITQLAQQGFPAEQEDLMLRIGFDSTEDHFETTGVTKLIADFQKAHPRVYLEMSQLPFSACTEKLLAGEMDMAFLILRHNETLPANLAFKPIFLDRIVLVLQDDDSVNTCREVLEKYDLVMVSGKPRGRSRLLRALEDQGIAPNIVTVDSIPASFTYLQAGKGCVNLPYNYFLQHHYQGMKVVPIPGDALTLVHGVAWNKSHCSSSIQELINSFSLPPELKERYGE